MLESKRASRYMCNQKWAQLELFGDAIVLAGMAWVQSTLGVASRCNIISGSAGRAWHCTRVLGGTRRGPGTKRESLEGDVVLVPNVKLELDPPVQSMHVAFVCVVWKKLVAFSDIA